MSSEQTEPNASTEETGEPGEQNDAEATQPETPTLNRAARRAQAKGKKGASGTPASGGFQPDNRFGGGNHPSFVSGKSRIPRTGHK